MDEMQFRKRLAISTTRGLKDQNPVFSVTEIKDKRMALDKFDIPFAQQAVGEVCSGPHGPLLFTRVDRLYNFESRHTGGLVSG